MKNAGRFLFGLALVSLAFDAPNAHAQDEGSMQVGGATLTIGGGTAILDLPDIEFTRQFDENNSNVISRRLTDNSGLRNELGWNVNGSISGPMGGGSQLSLNGFFARVENDDSIGCTTAASGSATCVWVNIVNGAGSTGIASSGPAVVSSQRNVNFWGASVASTWQLTPQVMGVTVAPNRRHISVAADIRGIDQDTTLRAADRPGGIGLYNEDLDTRYVGAYLAYGGDYTPFLFKGLWSRWGLQSSFQMRGGVYYADTDYSGRFFTNFAGTPLLNTRLSLSRNDTAFIGGLVLKTRKRINARTSLSLESEYDYYSYVPDMTYNDNNGGAVIGANTQTRIGSDDAYSARTSLRLTIKLGPREIMDPMK